MGGVPGVRVLFNVLSCVWGFPAAGHVLKSPSKNVKALNAWGDTPIYVLNVCEVSAHPPPFRGEGGVSPRL